MSDKALLRISFRHLEYALECNLATVEHMAGLSKPAVTQFNRQKSIARKTSEALRDMVMNFNHSVSEFGAYNYLPGGRAGELITGFNCQVESWLYKKPLP